MLHFAVESGPFKSESFDHVFVCFVLEHLTNPEQALIQCKKVLKPGGSITVIEGDHGSCYFYPPNVAALQAIDCLIKLQTASGGDALIGRRLYPLLSKAEFSQIQVSPRQVYADASRPEWVEGFIKKTFTAMIEGVAENALNKGLIDSDTWERGIAALYRTTQSDGTFLYTFFKGMAVK